MIGGENLLEAAKDLFIKSGGYSGYKTRQAFTEGQLLPNHTAIFLQRKLLCCRLHFSMAMVFAMQQSKDEEKRRITLPFTLFPLFTYIMTNFSTRNEVMNATGPELPRCLKLLLSHLKREISERMASIAQSIFR